MKILSKEEILKALDLKSVMQAIEDGFVSYSRGKAVVPPVGHMVFENPPGDLHIKYGYIKAADLIVADSRSQCFEHGETHYPLSLKLIKAEQVHELGEVIEGSAPARMDDFQITVADLTGVAVQDLKIAQAVFENQA